jgi:TorA maturation chaperone TorD
MSLAGATMADAAERQEETARAEMYGLLASLLCAPPSRELLQAIAAAPVVGNGILEQAWTALAAHARHVAAEDIGAEYDQLFIGVGKPEIILCGSYYQAGFMMEKPLAALRTDLARLGLQRPDSVFESEDHIAILCEVMRHLIVAEPDAIDVQRTFFQDHIQGWADEMWAAVDAHPQASFYRCVARLAASFFDVERQAFDMV